MRIDGCLWKRSLTPSRTASACCCFGLLLSIAGLAVLISMTWQKARVWHFAGRAIYGVTQVVLYAASTLYHGVRTPHLKPASGMWSMLPSFC